MDLSFVSFCDGREQDDQLKYEYISWNTFPVAHCTFADQIFLTSLVMEIPRTSWVFSFVKTPSMLFAEKEVHTESPGVSIRVTGSPLT